MEYSDGSNTFRVTKHGAFRVAESHIKDVVFKAESHTIHNPSFATTPLSPGKIKIVPPKLINFTYTKVSLNI
jgi:hypothetical protein